jgi:HEAT repeat protein
MNNTLGNLEKITHAWSQSEREELGRRFGIGWTALRYQGTGSVEGLEFLYPFLNDSDAQIRLQALMAAQIIFKGTGIEGLEKLSYITKNRDLFIRDRAVLVIGKTLEGESPEVIIDILKPSYTHKNNFIRGLGSLALGFAGRGKAGKQIFSILEKLIKDKNNFVAMNAIMGMAEAFSESGDSKVINILESIDPLPILAIARIGRNSQAENNLVTLIRQNFQPSNISLISPAEKRDSGFIQREAVWGMSWLLRGKAQQAFSEMKSYLSLSKSENPGRIPRSATIWSLPSTFDNSGKKGIEIAMSMLDKNNRPMLRAGILALGVAARASCDQDILNVLTPYLSSENGAIRDVANISVGLVFQKSGHNDVFKLLESTNIDDRRGPSTNYPFGVGLIYQTISDEKIVTNLTKLFKTKRPRLIHYAAFGIGLIYQGSLNAQAVEVLLPLLESKELRAACEALQLVDFDENALALLPRYHCLADGAGVAKMFVLKHFLDTPVSLQLPWITKLGSYV